jgi:amino acid transporter
VLPSALGRTHPRFHSPHIASTTQSVIAALIMGAFALFASVDHTAGAAQSVGYIQVYGLMAVMGVVSILAIQAIVSIAIVNYFRTHHKEEHHWWTTLTAPALSAAAQAYVLYLAIKNLDFLGSGYHYAKWLCWADLAIFVGGFVYALYLKRNDRAKYESVGRMINQGLDTPEPAAAPAAAPAQA